MKREWQLAPNHEEDGGIYHVISRVVWREFVFGDEEREYFRGLIKRYAQFCGIELLSYCIMSNHFHLLIKVPPKPERELDDAQFYAKLKYVYSASVVKDIQKQILEQLTKKINKFNFGYLLNFKSNIENNNKKLLPKIDFSSDIVFLVLKFLSKSPIVPLKRWKVNEGKVNNKNKFTNMRLYFSVILFNSNALT